MLTPASLIILPQLFFILSLAYGLLLVYAWYRWSGIKVPPGQLPPEPLFISVLVVVRNEEKNIPSLLKDLWNQRYPPEAWELLVIDDHSHDQTVPLVKSLLKESPVATRLLHMNGVEGKKQGLRWGMSKVRGELVVVTDGDCRLGPDWLGTYARQFSAGSVFISGPVTFTAEKNLFEKMQTIEFASLVGAGAVLLQTGYPGMCNAANMGFRAGAYREAEESRTDYALPSGDDEFLLQAIYRQYPQKVSFLKSRGAVVHTYAQRGWSSFFQQRKRWAGKWRHHKRIGPVLTALAVFTFHFCWLLLLGSVLAQGAWSYFFAGVLVKFTAESLFLYAVLHSFGKKMEWLPFVVLQLLHPVYVLFFALTINFGSFTWKERTYNYAKND